MFSQFRQAVENFAPQPRHGSADSQQDERVQDSKGPRYQTPLSSAQLADSALVNLRKSLASQRSGSPRPSSPRSHSPGASSIPRSNSLPDPDVRLPKSNLEDRLRAKFAIGEASNVTTPDVSGRASPATITSTQNHPLSPSLIPLPQSPILTPEPEQSTSGIIASVEPHILSSTAISKIPDSTVIEPRHPEADIPLPLDASSEFVDVDCPKVASPLDGIPPETGLGNVSLPEADIEMMQQRLRLVEQRFAGKFSAVNFVHKYLICTPQMCLCLSRDFRLKSWLLIQLFVSSPPLKA